MFARRVASGAVPVQSAFKDSLANPHISSPCGAKTALQFPADGDLARLVEAWPGLPESVRAAVLKLVGLLT